MKKQGAHSEDFIAQHIRKFEGMLRARRYSPRTVDLYRRAVLDFAAFLSTEGLKALHRVSATHLERYRACMLDRGFRGSSAASYLQAVRLLFRFLLEQQEVFVDPTEALVMMPAPRPLGPVPSEEEMRRLLEQPDTSRPEGLRDRALLETAYSSGLRRGELAGLCTADVDTAGGRLRVRGKGGHERLVPLGKQAVRWIERYLRESRPALLGDNAAEALWISARGRPLTHGAVPVILRRHLKAAGIATAVSPHAIRRACATHLLRNGAHPVEIQLLLGHASLRHLSQYLRLSISELRRTHAASRPGQ